MRAIDLANGQFTGAADLSFQPYWWDAAPRPQPARPVLPAEADVVIAGSGFTGLSAALTLARRGRKVVVLDRGVIGHGASTRNGGQIGSGNQKFRVKKLVALRGEEKARQLLREGTMMLGYIAGLINNEQIDCHFQRCGRFRGAMQPAHYDAMARDMDDLRTFAGVESFMVPKAEQKGEIGSDIFFGGSVLPHDASLHPGLYHAGLVSRVQAAGGDVVGEAGVTAIETERGRGFRVRTAAGDILCANVIVATNGYTGPLLPELYRRIVPVGSGLIATGVIEESLFARLLPKNRVYGNTNRVFYYYRAAPAERRIIWGGRAQHFSGNTSPAAYRHLARDMLHVFPELADVPVTHAWDGMIGFTHDEIPHLGRTGTGVHFALGYCGTGVSRATYFGHKIALQMLGDPEGRTAFDSLDFPAFPAHQVARRMVPVVETWYRVRDAARI